MATTWIKTPRGSTVTSPMVAMARSGVMYIVKNPIAETNNYQYALTIKVWRGLYPALPADIPTDADIFELRRYPNANGHGVFDISSILRGYFFDLDYNLPLETTGNLALHVYAKCGYVEVDGVITEELDATPAIIQAQNGYNYFTESVNYVIPQVNDGFLTDLPSQQLITKDRGYMTLYTRHTESSIAAGYMIKSDGGGTDTHFFTTGTPPADSSETILRMDVGYASLTPAVQAGITSWYDVVLIDGRSQPVGKPIRFTIQEPCKYHMYKIDWINRYGVWDRLFCFGNNQKEVDVEGYDAMRFIVDDFNDDKWKQGDGQFVTFQKTGRDMWTLNTGWLAEEYNKAMKQLFLAERVVVDGHSAILQEKAFQYKTALTDKMINYTFTFKFAFTSINTIG